MSAVGLSGAAVATCVRGQEARGAALDKLSAKEYEDPFKRK